MIMNCTIIPVMRLMRVITLIILKASTGNSSKISRGARIVGMSGMIIVMTIAIAFEN